MCAISGRVAEIVTTGLDGIKVSWSIVKNENTRIEIGSIKRMQKKLDRSAMREISLCVDIHRQRRNCIFFNVIIVSRFAHIRAILANTKMASILL